MELHPSFQQGELFQFSLDHGVQPSGYCPLGSPSRPERDRTPEDISDLDMPVLVQIARKHGVHSALVCLKWAVQRGQVPIPFSVKREQMRSNLRAVVEDPLTPEEMHALRAAGPQRPQDQGTGLPLAGRRQLAGPVGCGRTIPGWNGYGPHA